MAFGALVPAALGPVTAPTTIVLGTATSVKTGLASWGLYDPIPYATKDFNSVIFAHGSEAMRYALEGSSLRLGLLPPKAGLTAVSTSQQATSVLTFGASDVTDGARIRVWNTNDGSANGYIYFKTTLTPGSAQLQVKVVAGNVDATLTNLYNLLNDAGTEGTDYTYAGFLAVIPYASAEEYFNELGDIEASAMSAAANTVTFRAITPGLNGNTYVSIEVVADGQLTFGGTTFSGGATGSGTAPDFPSAGDRLYALGTVRSTDGALSGASFPYVEFSQSTGAEVTLDNYPAVPSRDGTDFYRVYRTSLGGDLLYKVLDDAADPATDDVGDEELTDRASRYKYDDRIFRPRVSGYPQVGRFGAIWRGRLWLGGAHKAADYSTGTASVTLDSDEVTLSATARPKEDWVGRVFRVASTTVEYVIVDVNPATRVLTLSRAYTGATNATASYTVRDARDPFHLTYSEPTLVNNFPPANGISGITSPDPSGITGVVAMWDSLVVFTRTGVWRVVGDTGAFLLQPITEGAGCFGNHAVQKVGGLLYWLGPEGVWRWGGVGDPEPLSTLRDSEESDTRDVIRRINTDEGDVVVSNYNPTTRRIRWWVPLDGETSNLHCLRLDVRSGSFALHTAPDITAAATAPGPAGTFVTVAGAADGTLYQLDTGDIDGAFGFEPVQTVASWAAGTRTITLDGTALPTSGDALKGIPAVLLPAAGPPYEVLKIASNTNGTVVLAAPPTLTPADGDYLIVGAIPLDAETEFDYEQPELLKWLEGLTLSHEVGSLATEVWCGASTDSDVPEVFVPRGGSSADSALMTATDGQKHFWLYTERGRVLRIRFLAFARGDKVRLRGFVPSIRAPLLEEVEG